MTDELRSQRIDVDGSTAQGDTAPGNPAARPRRRYTRPELTTFGTVKDLTRGASGNASDTVGKRRRRGGGPPGG